MEGPPGERRCSRCCRGLPGGAEPPEAVGGELGTGRAVGRQGEDSEAAARQMLPHVADGERAEKARAGTRRVYWWSVRVGNYGWDLGRPNFRFCKDEESQHLKLVPEERKQAAGLTFP